jgi:2-dehydro-3-deoxygalactonokinase
MLLKDRPELVSRPWVLIWPGSHTKMIAMDAQGSILGSYTTLAGELFAALKSATLLRRSMSESGELEYSDEIVDLAARTVWEQGLVRAAFWTRVADVRGTLDANQRSAWLSSAVIGADVDALSKHPWVTGDAGIQIIVGGDKVRQSLYSRLLRQRLNCQIEVLESHYCEQAAAVGAVYLAKIRRQSGC